MNELLRHRLATLTLKRDAPFPSETHTAKEMINAWRNSQRLHIVRPSDTVRDRDSDDDSDDPLEAA